MREPLMVMPSNNTGRVVRALAAAYPNRLGHLIGPMGWPDTVLPAGAQSCDGTGWLRGDRQQLQALTEYLRDSSVGVHAKRGVHWLFGTEATHA